MNAIALNNLWNYLQGLSLTASNQRWLGERLIDASTVSKTTAAKHRAHANRRSRGLTDEQLAECLSQYAPLTDSDFPELDKDTYSNFAKSNSGRIAKGLEKWL